MSRGGTASYGRLRNRAEMTMARLIDANEVGVPDAALQKARRPYVAPALTAFGSVEEFTRGTGSMMLDNNRVSRMATGA
jgi:hypothetical protein